MSLLALAFIYLCLKLHLCIEGEVARRRLCVVCPAAAAARCCCLGLGKSAPGTFGYFWAQKYLEVPRKVPASKVLVKEHLAIGLPSYHVVTLSQ